MLRRQANTAASPFVWFEAKWLILQRNITLYATRLESTSSDLYMSKLDAAYHTLTARKFGSLFRIMWIVDFCPSFYPLSLRWSNPSVRAGILITEACETCQILVREEITSRARL